MFHRTARVTEHVRLADRTFRVRLECPDIAAAIRPGQFVMLRLPNTTDPLLGRPFALYDTVLDATGKPVGLDVVYLVVGKMTGRLADVDAGRTARGVGAARASRSSTSATPDHVTLVAGGIGQTPFLAYARELLGTRGLRRRLAAQASRKGVALLRRAHRGPRGGRGGLPRRRGRSAPRQRRRQPRVQGVRDAAARSRTARPGRWSGAGRSRCCTRSRSSPAQWDVPCQVSLETPMACGVGICFSCVTKVKTPRRRGTTSGCAWTARCSTPPGWCGSECCTKSDPAG